jgi:tetratricopeptide (TPR) repeat protein
MKSLNRFILLILLGLWCSGCAQVFYVENPEKSPPAPPAKRVKYLNHTVGPGETLSQIAVHYYGTYKKFDVVGFIRKFNDIPDVRNLRVGDVIKIPYIKTEGKIKPDLAKLDPSPLISPEKSSAAPQTSESMETAPSAEPPSAEENLNQALALMNAGRYSEAIPKLEKAAEDDPSNADIRKYLYTACFQHAVERFEQEDFSAARAGFQKVMQYRTDCRECMDYAKIISEKGNAFLIEGIRLFNGRKYSEAVSVLKKALALDPGNERITEYLYKSYFEQAQEYYRNFQVSRDKLDYLAAQSALKNSRKYRKDCLPCTEYENLFKQKHYNKGIELYTRKESEGVDDAIREWERVLFVDPDYKKVKENIEEASNLLRKLRDLNKKNGGAGTYGDYAPSTWDSTTVTLSAPPANFASSMKPSTFWGNEISDVSTSRIRISSTMSVKPSEQSR